MNQIIETVWAKIDSWHLIDLRDAVPVAGAKVPTFETGTKARCGEVIPVGAPTDPDLPLGEPSCETCLRLSARDSDITDNPFKEG